jgi:toxin YoeB
MKINLSTRAEADIHHWNSVDPAKTARIVRLLENIGVTPFSGLGNPEPLKHDLTGFWSRRIDREHRLVYRIENYTVHVASCRFHY